MFVFFRPSFYLLKKKQFFFHFQTKYPSTDFFLFLIDSLKTHKTFPSRLPPFCRPQKKKKQVKNNDSELKKWPPLCFDHFNFSKKKFWKFSQHNFSKLQCSFLQNFFQRHKKNINLFFKEHLKNKKNIYLSGKLFEFFKEKFHFMNGSMNT